MTGGLLWLAMTLAVGAAAPTDEVPEKPLTGVVKAIDGRDVDLSAYAGKVVLVVNVASRCGFTRQYKELQAVYQKYEKQGLVVLGFPCNQFGKQEPGTNEQILAFCEKRFEVTFPMFAKIDVNGKDAPPLYQYLTSDKLPARSF